MDISVYKKPYNNSCQMSFIPSQNTSKSMSATHGASQEWMEWEKRDGSWTRKVAEGEKRVGKGEERGKGGAERGGKRREKRGGIAPWLLGYRCSCS